MVCTRGTSSFEQQFPIFHALAAGDAGRVEAVCGMPGEAAKCGPGNLSAPILALVLDADEHLPRLINAGAPVNTTLSLSFGSGELHKFLAVAKLTDSRELKHRLVAGHSALDMALALGKVEAARALVDAGAALDGLLKSCRHYGYGAYPFHSSSEVRRQVTSHALARYGDDTRLSEAAGQLLGQVACLALENGQSDTCMSALRIADQRQVAVSAAETRALLRIAATEGQPEVAMYLLSRDMDSLWHVLGSFRTGQRMHESVAAVLLPHLAQQYSGGKLEPRWCSVYHVAVLAQRALEEGQPGTCLLVLRSAAKHQTASMSANTAFQLLQRAAQLGHTEIVIYLLKAWDLLWGFLDERTMGRGWSSSVARVLFPHLAQQLPCGELVVESSARLARLLRFASSCGQPEACLSMLGSAAALQLELSEADAGSLLCLAASKGQRELVLQIHEASLAGDEAIWQLLGAEGMAQSVEGPLVQRLAEQFARGELAVDSTRLGLLVQRCAVTAETAACALILETAEAQWVQLDPRDADFALTRTVGLAGATGLVGLLLDAVGPITPAHASSLARQAAAAGQSQNLELLLGVGGAQVDAELLEATIDALSDSCLTVLLHHGALPVDTTAPFLKSSPVWNKKCTCPILRTLQVSARKSWYTDRALHMVEMLVAAGYAPTVYRNAVIRPGTAPVSAYDPLKEHAAEFDMKGANRWPALTLEPGGWSSATHSKHPPAMKRAFQTVLLAAAHGSKGPSATSSSEAVAPSKRPRQAGGAEAAAPLDAGLLASLPPELLLHVLHMAARPIYAWVYASTGSNEPGKA